MLDNVIDREYRLLVVTTVKDRTTYLYEHITTGAIGKADEYYDYNHKLIYTEYSITDNEGNVIGPIRIPT